MKTPLQEIVINLRRDLGLTQERFAAALGVGVITVARWENSREPSGVSLARLELFAIQNDQVEAARFLHSAALSNAAVLLPEDGSAIAQPLTPECSFEAEAEEGTEEL